MCLVYDAAQPHKHCDRNPSRTLLRCPSLVNSVTRTNLLEHYSTSGTHFCPSTGVRSSTSTQASGALQMGRFQQSYKKQCTRLNELPGTVCQATTSFKLWHACRKADAEARPSGGSTCNLHTLCQGTEPAGARTCIL